MLLTFYIVRSFFFFTEDGLSEIEDLSEADECIITDLIGSDSTSFDDDAIPLVEIKYANDESTRVLASSSKTKANKETGFTGANAGEIDHGGNGGARFEQSGGARKKDPGRVSSAMWTPGSLMHSGSSGAIEVQGLLSQQKDKSRNKNSQSATKSSHYKYSNKSAPTTTQNRIHPDTKTQKASQNRSLATTDIPMATTGSLPSQPDVKPKTSKPTYLSTHNNNTNSNTNIHLSYHLCDLSSSDTSDEDASTNKKPTLWVLRKTRSRGKGKGGERSSDFDGLPSPPSVNDNGGGGEMGAGAVGGGNGDEFGLANSGYLREDDDF